MAILDFFRRPAPIRDAAELADFIDRNAAFVTQKGIYEYARARAGHFAKVVFRETEFQQACDKARWSVFPFGLAMVAELVEGAMCPADPAARQAQLGGLRAIVLGVFDRYPAPALLGEETWQARRAELDRTLAQIALHPPKRAKDVAEPYAARYFDLMPIHKSVRGRDESTTRNYLRVTLCNIHDELTRRADRERLCASLTARGAATEDPMARGLAGALGIA
jgi:hypothetical protein